MQILYDSLVRNLIYNKEEEGVLSIVIFHCEMFTVVIKNINFLFFFHRKLEIVFFSFQTNKKSFWKMHPED